MIQIIFSLIISQVVIKFIYIMRKINQYLKQLNTICFILLLSLLAKLSLIILGVILTVLGIVPPEARDMGNIASQIFLLVIVAPLLETLISQSLAYKLLSKIRYFRSHKIWIIIISALMFGSLHYSSIPYVIFASLMGTVFMYAYILRIGRNPYWTTVAIHAIFNLASVLFSYYFPNLL